MPDPTASTIQPAAVPPASPVYAEYGAVAIVLTLALLLGLGIMTAVRVITRVLNRMETPLSRLTTYECGEEPVGRGWFRFNNRFYRIAIVFLACDILLALALPVLPRFGVHAATGHLAPIAALLLAVFGCLALVVAYAAAKGDFSWNKAIGFVAAAEARRAPVAPTAVPVPTTPATAGAAPHG